ncbi:MAG: hypothetical protein ACI9EF_000025 [Pseudohongiellaceae bacterium]|jgi:hypothetical protein
MDRQVITQVVAMLVVLSMALRWIPDTDPEDALGLGDPYNALKLDRQIAATNPDSDAVTAVLRSITHPGTEQEAYRAHWSNLLRQLQKIRDTADENTMVQFKGVVRNDVWPLIALLYPLRSTFATREMGTSHDDPDLPGTTHSFKANMRAWADMTAQEIAKIKADREAAARGRR